MKEDSARLSLGPGHLPEEKDIEWLWRGTDRKQIKPVVRGGGQEGQGGDEDDNIADGPLITAGS